MASSRRSARPARVRIPDPVLTRGSSLPTPAAQARVTRPSAVSYELGGRLYPLRDVPNCHVCKHPDRVMIERLALRGYGPTAIRRSLPSQVQEGLSVESIGKHCREHLPVDLIVRQAIVEARAKEIGLDPDTETGSLVDRLTFARVGLQKVYERMADGEIRPGFSEGIAFAQIVERAEQVGGTQYDTDALAQGFMVYMSAIRAVCTSDQIRQIGAFIAADPVMQALYQRGQTIEATAS